MSFKRMQLLTISNLGSQCFVYFLQTIYAIKDLCKLTCDISSQYFFVKRYLKTVILEHNHKP